jgi:hypothetical protein
MFTRPFLVFMLRRYKSIRCIANQTTAITFCVLENIPLLSSLNIHHTEKYIAKLDADPQCIYIFFNWLLQSLSDLGLP